MTAHFLEHNKTRKVLMDGVIRSREQNDAIGGLFGNFDVIYLDLDVEIAVTRLGGRRIDPVTHETFPASYTGEKNPKTGNILIVRVDDTEDAIRKRIEWSIADTLPLLDVWRDGGHTVYTIDADQSEEEIFLEIEKVIMR